MSSPTDTIELIERNGGVLLRVKVVPGASRSRVLGVWNGGLRVAVAAPPEKGKANQEVVALLAEALGVSQRSVTIEAGAASPRKTVRVAGVTAEVLRHALCTMLARRN